MWEHCYESHKSQWVFTRNSDRNWWAVKSYKTQCKLQLVIKKLEMYE